MTANGGLVGPRSSDADFFPVWLSPDCTYYIPERVADQLGAEFMRKLNEGVAQ